MNDWNKQTSHKYFQHPNKMTIAQNVFELNQWTRTSLSAQDLKTDYKEGNHFNENIIGKWSLVRIVKKLICRNQELS